MDYPALPKPGDRIKAITLYEPWATLMALGEKRIETRDWQTTHRGWVGIHTSRTFDDTSRACCLEDPFLQVLTAAGKVTAVRGLVGGKPMLQHSFAFGVVIALGYLADAQRTTHPAVRRLLSERPRELAFGNYNPGRSAHIYSRVVPLVSPIPASGRMMLWEWTVPEGVRYARTE